MSAKTLLALLVLLTSRPAHAQEPPAIPYADRVRLSEAFRIGDTLGDEVWTDWDTAPFAVLLVTPEHEFLIRHERPSEDFEPAGYDLLLKSEVFYRPRTQSPNLLATFPVVGGIPTIVIGQAENTLKKTSTPWVVTVLHEHFHQLQYSRPGYYEGVNALNLSGDDETGMWMLNYPFPYMSSEVGKQFALLGRLLAETLETGNQPSAPARIERYLGERRKLDKMLSADDYKYLSFQLWQEGIARYTECRIAELAADRFEPSKEFKALDDYEPFQKVAASIRKSVMDELSALRLDESERVAFYALGAGEGFLLDILAPEWHNRYFVDRFRLDDEFDIGD